MGRPLNNKFFGAGSDKLSITFNNGTEVVNGYIVKQLGTSSYRVGVVGSEETYDVSLAGNISSVSELTDLKAAIAALNSEGEQVFITKLQSTKFTTSDGTQVVWAQSQSEGSPVGSIITVGEVAPVEPEEPEEPELPTEADATFIGDLLDAQKHDLETNMMFFGTGNLASDYVVSRNPRNGIEVGLKVHKRSDDTSFGVVSLVDGVATYMIPADDFVVSNEVRRVTWVLNYAVAAEDSLDDFTIELEFNLDPLGVADPVVMTRATGGDWFIGETRMMELDGMLITKNADISKVDQNATNIGYASFDAYRPEGISETWATDGGSFPVTIRAIKEGVTVAEASIVVVTAEGITWK